MSWRSDTAELVAGGWTSSAYPGLGVTGAVVRATTGAGAHGAGIFYNDWQSSADDTKEFYASYTRLPRAGTFTPFEDGSYAFVGPDGGYTFVYRLYVDGVDTGLAPPSSFFVGNPTATASGLGAVATGEAFGVPTLTFSGLAVITGLGGISTAEGFGVPGLSSGSSYSVIDVGGISSAEGFGSPTLDYVGAPVTWLVTGLGGIASAEAFGAVAVAYAGTRNIIDAGGIASALLFGTSRVTMPGSIQTTDRVRLFMAVREGRRINEEGTRGFTLLAGKPVIDKDPDEELDYSIGFQHRIPSTDTLASHELVNISGVDVVQSSIDSTGSFVDMWIRGGQVQGNNSVTVRVVTAGAGGHPLVLDQTLYFKVDQK